MEKKKLVSSKMIMALVIAAMLLTLLVGCENNSSNTVSNTPAIGNDKTEAPNSSAEDVADEITLPITDKPITLTYWKALDGSAAKVIQNLNENEAFKEMERRTGIHIEFLHPPVGQETEQYKLMIATGDYPDMIEHHWYAVYPGGPDKGIEDGVFLRLNEYIEKYAPNFRKLRETNDVIRALTITDAGNIWSFPEIQLEDEAAWNGPVIRTDWLEELGLEMPTTISEWYNVLSEFKNKKGVQSPLMIPKNGYDDHHCFIGAYGVAAKFFKVNDVVKYGPLEPGFKEYITEMRKWYSEGLIDQDFMTRDSKSTTALILSDQLGAWTGSYGSWLQTIINTKNDPSFKIAPAPYPSLKPGEKVHLRNRSWNNKGYDTAITTACKYPVEAVKWLDYCFSEEGYLLFNYGIEGVSYVMVDGKPQFTDLLVNNPDGISYTEINWKYKTHVGTYLRDWRAYPFTDIQYQAMEVWNRADYDYVIPPVSLTPEESTSSASIMNEIYTYVNQMVLKFIVGNEPMENYDSFVEQIKKMNIDEAIKIYQNALDRYNKR